MNKLEFIVPPEFSGRKIEEFLRGEKGVSYGLLKKLKREVFPLGIVKNGAHARTIDRLCTGDKIVLCWEETGYLTGLPEQTELAEVLFENEGVIVFNKPPGMTCHPARKHQQDTLGNVCAAHQQKHGQSYLFRPVNRLDKDTSGIVVVAKNQFTASKLVAQRMQKEYLALVHGILPPEGTIDEPIYRVDPVHILRAVGPQGKKAVTHYRTLAASAEYSLIKLRLETGRTHQIRVHMAHIGHPLAGDVLYGGTDELLSGQALHCESCRFFDPVSEKDVLVRAPMHHSLQKALENAYIFYDFA